MVISVSLEPAVWINLTIYIQHVCRNRIITDFFFKRSIYVYIFFWLHWVLVAHSEYLLCHVGSFTVAHGHFSCGMRAPESRGFSTYGMRAELLRGRRDLSSLTRDQSQVPCAARQILHHWTHQGSPSG